MEYITYFTFDFLQIYGLNLYLNNNYKLFQTIRLTIHVVIVVLQNSYDIVFYSKQNKKFN